MMHFNFRKLAALGALIALGACSQNQGFQDLGISQIGSGLLGSTGLVSGSQADAIFSAGGKLAKANQKLTPEQEYYLGRGVSAMIFSKYRALKSQNANAYLTKVGLALAANSDKPETYSGYHFVVLDTDEVNAMSAPGGFVFVSRGLLAAMPDEDALASVIAHEIGHVVLDHGLNAISQSNLTDALMIVGKEAASSYSPLEVGQLVETFGGSVSDVFSTLIDSGYSRSQEYAADKYAAGLLQKTGYQSASLVNMLESLKRLEEGKSGGWYSTHPSPKKRIGELEDEGVTANTRVDAGYAKRTARFRQLVKGIV